MDQRNAIGCEGPLAAPGRPARPAERRRAAVDLATGLADLARAVRELAVRHEQLETEWRVFKTRREEHAGPGRARLGPDRRR